MSLFSGKHTTWVELIGKTCVQSTEEAIKSAISVQASKNSLKFWTERKTCQR